jgi:hypothetical protein
MVRKRVDDDTGADTGLAVSRKTQLLEVAVFLFLIVPSLVLSLFVTPQGSEGFRLTAAMVIARDLALLSLVLFFLQDFLAIVVLPLLVAK